MRKIKVIMILNICLALLGFIMGGISAQETPFVWHLDGGLYHMISPPYVPEDRDPQVSLADNLGLYNRTQWRFFRYNPVDRQYAELKTSAWGSEQDFDFGRGYWIISRNPDEIDIWGEPIGEQVERQIILQHEGDGWNQIGNIFDYVFPIASLYVVRITDPDPINNRVQLIDQDNNDLTYVTLQEFENGSYIDIPTIGKTNLEVGESYWLRVREGVGEDVILWFVVTGLSTLSEEIYLSEEFFERVAQQEDPPDPPPAIVEVSFSSGSASGGCFIATAIYKDYEHPRVQLLREFRDQYLLTNSLGRMFVDMYYRWSPALARFLEKRKPIMALVRFSLMPIIGFSTIVSKIEMHNFLIVFVFPLLVGFFLLKKGGLGVCKPKFSIKSKQGKRKL